MQRSVKKYVQECVKCQLATASNRPTYGELKTWEDANATRRMSIDFKDPLPNSKNGNQYLCVAVDMGSRWIVTKPMKTIDAQGTHEFLFEDIVCRYGMFQKLVSDRGSNFMSETFQAFFKIPAN